MSAVLRLSPDLAIVPSMVCAVDVMPVTDSHEFLPLTFDHRQCGWSVWVRYLMAENAVRVAVFSDRLWAPGGLSAQRLYSDEEEIELLAASEARARVVYEEILRAVKDAAT